MAERIVDRFEAIDIENDKRAVGLITVDVSQRAVQFPLKTTPVENTQQIIGVGLLPESIDFGKRSGKLGLEGAQLIVETRRHRSLHGRLRRAV